MRSWWSRTGRALRLLRQLRSLGDAMLCSRIALFVLAVPVLLRLKLPTLERLLMGSVPGLSTGHWNHKLLSQFVPRPSSSCSISWRKDGSENEDKGQGRAREHLVEEGLIGSATATTDSVPARKIITCIDSLLATERRPPGRSRCLTRGLSLFYFLRKARLDVSLCFGIGKINGQFIGHCWLLKDGEPFLEAQDPRTVFTAIYAMPQRLQTDDPVGLPERAQISFR